MNFIITGDSLFSSQNLAQTIDEALVAKLQTADAVFTNAEFVTPNLATPPAAGRGYVTSVRPALLDEFTKLNIRYVGFANNHTGDFGIQGMLDTLEESRKRNIIPLGIAENLYNARKPVFIDHADCRIALITIDVTRSEVFAALDSANGLPARPGVNPLRWDRKYVVSPKDLQSLEAISQRSGFSASMDEAKKIELWKAADSREQLDLGSFFEGYISFVAGEQPGVETTAKESDRQAILASIEDAKKRSDFVFVSLHTHEGENENWYSEYPAAFIEQFSQAAIDAGANIVFGHGAHFTRGIQNYHGGTIFYNLGSLLMEFEAGESLLPSEMNEAYGYASAELPSTLHSNRVKDSDGNWQGFYSDPKFEENFLVSFDLKSGQEPQFQLIATNLQLRNDRVTKRGLPIIADARSRRNLIAHLNAVSQERYLTEIVEENGVIKVRSLE